MRISIKFPQWHKRQHMAKVIPIDAPYLSRIIKGEEYLSDDNRAALIAYYRLVQEDAETMQNVLNGLSVLKEKDIVSKYRKLKKTFGLLQQKL